MTPDEQRIAIAEACGIVIHAHWGPLYKTPKGIVRVCPDYLRNLNDMYEAEATMNLTDKYQYGKSICKIMNIDTEGGLDVADIYYVCHASAAQRAEAFLRTIGKWEGAK
jgi:hypothetical protein